MKSHSLIVLCGAQQASSADPGVSHVLQLLFTAFFGWKTLFHFAFFISSETQCFDKQDTEIRIQRYWNLTTHQVCCSGVCESENNGRHEHGWHPVVPQRLIAKPSTTICPNILCHIFLTPHHRRHLRESVSVLHCRVPSFCPEVSAISSGTLNCHSVISHGLGSFWVGVLWPDEKKLNLKDLPLQRRERQINPPCQCGTCFLLSPAVNRVIARETEPATRLTLDKVVQIRFSFRFVKVQLQLPIIALRRKRKGGVGGGFKE